MKRVAHMSDDSKIAIRQRTFLKGTVYYDNRRASIEGVIRDISDSGARITFEHAVIVPDNVELFIPHRQETLRARVQRRGPQEIGVAFEIDRALEPRRAADADLQERVAALEDEIKSLNRLVAKLKSKVKSQSARV